MKRPRRPQPMARLAGALLVIAALTLGAGCAEIAGLAPYRGVMCYLNPGRVDVSGSDPTVHRYTYTLDCDLGLWGEAHGAYDVSTGVAQEEVTGAHGQRVRAKWSCVRDPWIRAETDNFRCTRQSASFDGNGPLLDVAKSYEPDYPYSTWYLLDWQRGFLASRLTNALNAKPPTTTPPPPPPLSAKLPPLDRAPSTITSRIIAAPTNFQARRDQSGLFIELTWTDSAIAEGYYEVRAFNHQTGNPIPRRTVPADTTRYIDKENTSQVGGVDYELRACLGAECSTPAKATFLR